MTKIPLFSYHAVKKVSIGESMVRTQIQLTEEQVKTLRKLASSRHFSIAELIRRTVDHLIKSSAVVDTEERHRRAIDAAGRFGSGVSDLSTSHDKHLIEALQRRLFLLTHQPFLQFRIETAFTFASHFKEQGFKCIP